MVYFDSLLIAHVFQVEAFLFIVIVVSHLVLMHVEKLEINN